MESRRPRTHTHARVVSLFAYAALSAATGVSQSNTDSAFSGEESSASLCLSGSVRRSGAALEDAMPSKSSV